MFPFMRIGPRTQSRTTDTNLDCVFIENGLVFVVPNIGECPFFTLS